MKYYLKFRPIGRKPNVVEFTFYSDFKLMVVETFVSGHFICCWSIDDDGNCYDYSISAIRDWR